MILVTFWHVVEHMTKVGLFSRRIASSYTFLCISMDGFITCTKVLLKIFYTYVVLMEGEDARVFQARCFFDKVIER